MEHVGEQLDLLMGVTNDSEFRQWRWGGPSYDRSFLDGSSVGGRTPGGPTPRRGRCRLGPNVPLNRKRLAVPGLITAAGE
jgi:hypothetical protein